MKHLKVIFDLLLLPFLFFSLFLTFTYVHAESGGSTIGDSTSNNPVVWIDDALPTIRNITEGDSGTTTVYVTAHIDICPDTAPVNVKLTTQQGTASHYTDTDYIWKNENITFAKDSCTKNQTFTFTVNGDTNIEFDEYFDIVLADNGTDSTQSVTIKFTDRIARINIVNDDIGADLKITKSVTDYFYGVGDTVTYTIQAQNRGPSPSRIRVIDSLPAGLSFISASDNIATNFACSESGGTITCDGLHNFTINEVATITIKAKVDSSTFSQITNTATVSSPNGLTDPDLTNNTASVYIFINTPGGQGMDVNKTVSNTTPIVGQNVNFSITIKNAGLDRNLTIEDIFPLTSDVLGTTGGAFELVSYTTTPSNVTCNELTYGADPYLSCTTNENYTDGQSFTVNIVAKIKKRGQLCNTAIGSGDSVPVSGSDIVCMNAIGINPPDLIIPNQSEELFSAISLDLTTYTTDADGDTNFTYSNISGLPPGLSMNSDGLISGTLIEDTLASYPQVYTVVVTVTDGDGLSSQDDFTITVTEPDLFASDNNYSGNIGLEISGNFITDDTGNGIDSGMDIQWQSCSSPSRGTVTCSTDGNFTYTPNVNANMTDYFTYTISDKYGYIAQATVTLRLGVGGYTSQNIDFVRINPNYTQNIVGDYLVIGNTVQCITEKEGTSTESDSYNGSCQNGSGYFNNNYMTKYIDIDKDNSTWNSSSANFTIPDTYDNSDGKGILWAGLFWQGSVNNKDSGFKQRRAEKNGTTYSYKDITSNEPYNIPSSPAKEISIKFNSSSTYTTFIADNLNYDQEHGDFGGYYAAYADITSFVQDKNLSAGEHTAIVANISSNEGRENLVGNYAGWSLVIIYQNDPHNEPTPKNISIYQGFKIISGDKTDPAYGRTHEIPITGFKLPSEGSVEAKLSVFAGEGEEIYGSTPTTYDLIYLKRDATSPEYNITNTDNIFDAHLINISRDLGNDNNVDNTNGIDVDDYNVSSILEDFRDADKNTSSLLIKMVSNDDYVIINMIAFSTELYVPELCYNYTLDIDGDVIHSQNNEIKTPFGGYGDDLTTVLYLQSLDGDIPLDNVEIQYSINDSTQVSYKFDPCDIWISEIGKYAYSDACPYIHSASSTGFNMYIGTGKNSSEGGTISANEDRYIKFYSSFGTSNINTSFNFSIEYTANFGSGDIPFYESFDESKRCKPVDSGYSIPTLGFLNIVDIDNDHDQWNLYTQTSQRAFNLKLFAYDASNLDLIDNDLNLSVEIEMIRADEYKNDTETTCNDSHATLQGAPVKFVHFNQNKNVTFGYAANEINFAYRNVALRMWYLTDVNNSNIIIDDHNCTANTQDACISLYQREYTTKSACMTECGTSSTEGCYACLRSFYGKKICSRDNFAIRPESFYRST